MSRAGDARPRHEPGLRCPRRKLDVDKPAPDGSAHKGAVPLFRDVETRSRLISPGRMIRSTRPLLGPAHGGCGRSLEARQVSPIQLAAMIYYNRGVDLLGEKRFAEAARANAKALRLIPKTPRPGATCWPP